MSVHPLCGRFDGKKDVANLSRGKTSVMRNIKRQIKAQYPMMEDKIEELIPKKGDVTIAKWCVGNHCLVRTCVRP